MGGVAAVWGLGDGVSRMGDRGWIEAELKRGTGVGEGGDQGGKWA
jgi:hypothetical protein